MNSRTELAPSEPGASHLHYRALMLTLFPPTGRPGAWRQQAACRGKDPEMFFDPDQTSQAAEVCAGCPVIADCRADQLAFEKASSSCYRLYASGVTGGLSGRQRNTIHYPRTIATKEIA